MNKSSAGYQLSNKAWLLEQLRLLSPQELADKLGCHRGSVDWAMKKLSIMELKQVKFERRGAKIAEKLNVKHL